MDVQIFNWTNGPTLELELNQFMTTKNSKESKNEMKSTNLDNRYNGIFEIQVYTVNLTLRKKVHNKKIMNKKIQDTY